MAWCKRARFVAKSTLSAVSDAVDRSGWSSKPDIFEEKSSGTSLSVSAEESHAQATLLWLTSIRIYPVQFVEGRISLFYGVDVAAAAAKQLPDTPRCKCPWFLQHSEQHLEGAR